jgi:hypothetical protein
MGVWEEVGVKRVDGLEVLRCNEQLYSKEWLRSFKRNYLGGCVRANWSKHENGRGERRGE